MAKNSCLYLILYVSEGGNASLSEDILLKTISPQSLSRFSQYNASLTALSSSRTDIIRSKSMHYEINITSKNFIHCV